MKKIQKKISKVYVMLSILGIIFIFGTVLFAFIFDYNITAVWKYPFYSFLNALSGYFRYSALFPFFAILPLFILTIMAAVILEVKKSFKDGKKRLSPKKIYSLLAIVLFAILLKFAVPSMVEDFQLAYNKKENSIVIKSDEVERHRKMKGYRFTADIYEENMTLDFTSYQYYNIRKANEHQNGRSIRVYYLERENLRNKVFAYELLDEGYEGEESSQ